MNRPRHIRAVLFAALLGFFVILIALPQSDQLLAQSSNTSPLFADLNANRPVQALYQIETIASHNGWTPDIARIAGDQWQTLGDLPRAVAFWEIAAKDRPSDLALAKQLAQSDLDLQRWSAATIALNQVVKISPDDNWAHYHLGLLQAAFDPQSALEHLRLASRESVYQPIASDFLFLGQATANDATTVMHVGLVLASHQLWNYAEPVFQYAAALAPPFPEALAYTALARDNQGKNGSPQIEQAISLDPVNAQVLYLEGLHFRLQGDNTASLNALLQAATLQPLNPAFAAELGAAYQLTDQLDQAQYWLKQAVALSKDDPRFQGLLTQFYQQFPSLGP